MRHHDNNRKFGRERKVRKGFIRSLIRGLVINGRIQTTLPRAKEIRPLVEKMVSKARRNPESIATLRVLAADMGGQLDVAKLLINEYAPKYTDRNGGYVRIMKLPNRLSDGSEMALIEFV